MKNPLVEALRQAEEGAVAGVTEESISPTHAGVMSDKPAMESESIAAAEDKLDLFETDSRDALAGAESRVDSALPDSTLAVDEPSSTSAEGDDPAVGFAATAMLSARGAVLEEKRPLIATVGRLSPFICLVALALSIGGYLLVSNLAGANLNGDLADMSDRVRMPAEVRVGVAEIPKSATSVFAVPDVSGTTQGYPPASGIDATQSASTNSSNTSVQLSPGQPEYSAPIVPTDVTVVASSAAAINDQAHRILLDAYAAYQSKNYPLAERHYLQALAVVPNHLDALSGIAAIYVQMNRKHEAERIYEKLLVVDPGNMSAVAGIWSLRSADATSDADSELKHLIQRYPKASHLHFALGEFYAERGRWPDAKHAFLSAHELAPRNADYSYNVAVCLERLGDRVAASHYYRAALETADENSNIDRPAIVAHLDGMVSSGMERL